MRQRSRDGVDGARAVETVTIDTQLSQARRLKLKPTPIQANPAKRRSILSKNPTLYILDTGQCAKMTQPRRRVITPDRNTHPQGVPIFRLNPRISRMLPDTTREAPRTMVKRPTVRIGFSNVAMPATM